jgi:hypothetical protein
MFEMRHYPEYNERESEVNLLLQDLIDAKNRGVEVKVILEGGEDFLGTEFEEKQKKSCLFLQNSGIDIKFDPRGITTHAKLVIVDHETVIIGSTNWNFYSLKKNKEASALIKSKAFARDYENYFSNLWKISKEAKCEIFPTETCSSIEKILSNREECDGRTVRITGVATNIKQKVSKAGNDYTTFKLTTSDGKDGKSSLKIFTFGHPSIFEGENIIVKGTYHKEKYVSGFQYYDEIEAEEIEKI